eukprot:CRZ02864.1 hypothetical protein [Spongospora subterranea]
MTVSVAYLVAVFVLVGCLVESYVFDTSPDNCRGVVSENAKCGPNHQFHRCPVGECCSKNGKCGSGDKFCLDHPICPIQKKFVTTIDNCRGSKTKDGFCGPDFGFKQCGFGHCCSQDGKCMPSGSFLCTEPACPTVTLKREVESKFTDFGASLFNHPTGFKHCSGVLSTERSDEDQPLCGPAHRFMRCPYQQCCNQHGKCSTSDEHCHEKKQICPRQPYTGEAEYVDGKFKADDKFKNGMQKCRGIQRPDRTCGPLNAFGSCKVGECCDKHGRCAIGEACSAKAAPLCPVQPKPVPSPENCSGVKTTRERKCGPHYNFMHCEEGECCSFDGVCGSTKEHCNDHSFCPKQGKTAPSGPKWIYY